MSSTAAATVAATDGAGSASPPSAPPSPTMEGTALAPSGSWVPGGTLSSDWYPGTLMRLGGGGALAVTADGTQAMRWDPTSATWHAATPLNAARSNYAAVPLEDGRVLVAGGSNDNQQAYSSAYVYDPATPKGTWTKAGLMGTARSLPAAAVLHDGRVLVAGGAYFDRPALVDDPAGVVRAAYRTGETGSDRTRRVDDVAPSRTVPALATAEIFDPATGTWSPTGSMRYARAGATAVTLADGRVLVVSPGGVMFVGGDTGATVDERAATATEVYDPATGRFTLVGGLPEIDRSAIAAAGATLPDTAPDLVSVGTLVALPDGGALLVGHVDTWKYRASLTRTIRFDGATGEWTQVGPATAGTVDQTTYEWSWTPGLDLAGAFAATLADGHVLVAGGIVGGADGMTGATTTARTFDPATGTWAPLVPMPEARVWGSTAILDDGSVLLAGGDRGSSDAVTAVRFVPAR